MAHLLLQQAAQQGEVQARQHPAAQRPPCRRPQLLQKQQIVDT